MNKDTIINSEMTQKTPVGSACPDSETLSAYFDKEIQLDEAQLEHIKHCPSCSTFLKVCSMISSAVVHTPDEVYTDDTPEHILSATKRMIIKERLDESRKKYGFTFRRWIPAIAAIFVFSAFIGYLFYANGYLTSNRGIGTPDISLMLPVPNALTNENLNSMLGSFAKIHNLSLPKWDARKTECGGTRLAAELTQQQYSDFTNTLKQNGFDRIPPHPEAKEAAKVSILIVFTEE